MVVLEAPLHLEPLQRPLPPGLVRVGDPHHFGSPDPEPDCIESMPVVAPSGVPDNTCPKLPAGVLPGGNQLWHSDSGGSALGKKRSALHHAHHYSRHTSGQSDCSTGDPRYSPIFP